jgi:hypothetical protein
MVSALEGALPFEEKGIMGLLALMQGEGSGIMAFAFFWFGLIIRGN